MNRRKLYEQITPGQFSFLAYAAQMGFGFITFLLLVRKCSLEVFGWWVLMVSLSSIADQARTGLIQNGSVRLLKQNGYPKAVVMGSALVLSFLASGILAGVIVVAWHFYGFKALLMGGEFWQAALLFSLGFLAQAYARVGESIWMADLRFDRLFWVKLSLGLSLFLGVLLTPTPDLLQLVRIQAVSWGVGLLVYLILSAEKPGWDRSVFRELFVYGRYVMGTNLGSMLYNKMDVLILGSMLGPIAVGLYNAASRITNFVEVPLSSQAQVVFPRLAKRAAQGDVRQLVKEYEKGLGQVLLVLTPLCILVFAFAKPLLFLLAGPEYTSGAIILQLLSLAVLIKPWGRFLGITLDAINRPQLNFYFLLVWMVVNVLLNILLIPVWGVNGVAIATLLSVVGNAVVGQWVLRSLLPIRPQGVLRTGFAIIFKTKN